jgi:hypothetical protein
MLWNVPSADTSAAAATRLRLLPLLLRNGGEGGKQDNRYKGDELLHYEPPNDS